MKLRDILQTHKATITEKWLDLTLATYPSRSFSFFKKKKNQFANPVGHTLATGIAYLFDDLLDGLDRPEGASAERLCSHLEEVIKVRSIQEYTPARAVSFVFFLKQAIREELQTELQNVHLLAELARFEAQIDRLALLAFDIFTKCREKLYELRINEVKRTGFRLLKKANVIALDEDPESQEDWALTSSDACRPRGCGP